ncbi:MAG TPA: hypothetical protein VKF41_01380 [Bryobacteraceae bacterium]|nr:hypothetical protein [Bryobacteraceae bacterium]
MQGPDTDASVLAIVANQEFPDGKLALGSVNLSASTGASIPFSAAGGKDSVALSANASGFFAAGIYPDPADLVKDLSPERDIAGGLALTAQPGSRFFMLRCGYDVGAAAKGAVALGTGITANFGGSASRKADYAVIHEFQNAEGARDVLESTIRSWILPCQFEGPDAKGEFQIQPRTWIVTEVDGSVALNLGVQAGYDYSWMRQFPGGVLKGDLGLKVQLAANAALGFSANGAFAVALSRETEAPVFRLRLFKLDKDGWNFALDASAGEQVTLPDVFQQGKNIDDLISAVFGVHTAQLVQDLTDPGITSASSVAKFIEQRGMKEFASLTGVNPDQLFAAGKAKVDQFVADWNALTHKPATMLAKILKQNMDVDKLTAFLQKIQGLDQAGVTAEIAKAMGDADFFQTAVGQFVNSTVLTTPLGAILGGTEWKTIQTLAGKALDIVNGNTLQSLIDYATKSLGLDVIQQVKSDVDAFNLDAWLQAKLAGFLGKDPATKLALADVQKVQTALKALLDNAEKFYDLARQAVQKKYEIDFTSTYQKSTTTTALLDVAFDLAKPGVVSLLQQAIDGDMQRILLQMIPGVTINAATLTHDINRQSHSDLTMPFVNFSTDDVSDSIASVSPVEENGRVLLYKVDAQDEVKDHTGFFHARTASDSKLALAATIPVRTGIVQFSLPSVSYAYTLTKAASAMGAAQLQQDLTPLAGEYMPGIFDRKPLGDWVAAVDGQIDSAHTGVLGPVVFSFDVSLPPTAFQAWFGAPANAKDPRYFAMSKELQRRLRQIIPFYYFQDPANYDGGVAANAVLAYKALPASNGFQLTADNKIGAAKNEIYFDLDGTPTIQALMNTPDFGAALEAAMQAALAITQGTGEGSASFYEFDQVNVNHIIHDALTKESQTDLLPAVLGALLWFEFDLIDCVVKAAAGLAKFRTSAAADPSAAIAALSAFGDTFVRAFNQRLAGNVVAGSYLRSLGSALFVEAGRALAQNGAAAKPAGLFRMTVLDAAPSLSVDDMLAGNFGQAEVILRQTLVSL